MSTPSRTRRSGFSLLEVIIALLLVVLIGGASAAMMREGVDSLTIVDDSTHAVAALREMHEFLYDQDVASIEALDGQTMAPVLGTGDPMTEADDLRITVRVETVDDVDPNVVLAAGDSGTRKVTLTVTKDGTEIEDATWLVTEN